MKTCKRQFCTRRIFSYTYAADSFIFTQRARLSGRAGTLVKVAFISDLHFDHNAGLLPVLEDRLREISVDVLVLGGDLFSGFSRLGAALRRLRTIVPNVLFLPGNHDLWVNESGNGINSRQLYESILPRVAANEETICLGMEPVKIGEIAFVGVTGWYEDYPQGQVQSADATACIWPDFSSPAEVLAWQADLLEQQLRRADAMADRIFVITHTVAFMQLLADSIPEDLRPYMGSDKLGDIILRHPKIVYAVSGHLHARFLFSLMPRALPWEISPFGYPNELGKNPRDTMAQSLRILDF